MPVFIWDVKKSSLKCLSVKYCGHRLRECLEHVAVGFFLFLGLCKFLRNWSWLIKGKEKPEL